MADDTALVGLALQLAGGVAGEAMSAQERAKAERRIQQLLAKLAALPEPEFEQLQATSLHSQAGDTAGDAQGDSAELAALQRLSQIDREGGLTLSDRAALNEVQNQTALADSRNRAALSSEFQRRGQLGSGAQLAMSMQGQQAAANRMSQEGMDVAGKAQQRALQAVMSRGQLGAQRDQRKFGQNLATGQARDEIARWNAAQAQDRTKYNNAMGQQRFTNKFSKVTGEQQGVNSLADMYNKQADSIRTTAAGVSQAGRELFRDDDSFTWDPATGSYRRKS